MAFCRNCGTEISPNAAVCPKCGEPQEVKTGETKIELNAKTVTINKHVFVWVGAFLFGGIGVDRFMRGQIGLGILKIITVSCFGIWALIDWIISLVKAYGDAFGSVEDITFVNGKYGK